MNNLKRKKKNISIVRRNENIYYIVQFKGKYIGCFKRIDDAQNKVRELYRLETKVIGKMHKNSRLFRRLFFIGSFTAMFVLL